MTQGRQSTSDGLVYFSLLSTETFCHLTHFFQYAIRAFNLNTTAECEYPRKKRGAWSYIHSHTEVFSIDRTCIHIFSKSINNVAHGAIVAE